MNWDAVGSVAETIGALGVILSLIYLANQIRNQNRQARLDSINELTRQRNECSGNWSITANSRRFGLGGSMIIKA